MIYACRNSLSFFSSVSTINPNKKANQKQPKLIYTNWSAIRVTEVPPKLTPTRKVNFFNLLLAKIPAHNFIHIFMDLCQYTETKRHNEEFLHNQQRRHMDMSLHEFHFKLAIFFMERLICSSINRSANSFCCLRCCSFCFSWFSSLRRTKFSFNMFTVSLALLLSALVSLVTSCSLEPRVGPWHAEARLNFLHLSICHHWQIHLYQS